MELEEIKVTKLKRMCRGQGGDSLVNKAFAMRASGLEFNPEPTQKSQVYGAHS